MKYAMREENIRANISPNIKEEQEWNENDTLISRETLGSF